MYSDHVPQISAAMRSDPEAFVRGCLFAVASMRMPITRVPYILAEIDSKGEFASGLFGHKQDAYQYLMSHGTALWERCKAAPDARAFIFEVSRVPGIGIVKAGFVAQMYGHNVGCIDSRNEARLGYDAERWRTRGPKSKAGKAFQRRLDDYLTVVSGRAHELWDDWCKDVAEAYDREPQEISAIHLEVCR